MLNVQPSSRQNIISENGNVSNVWYVWFDQIYKTIKGVFDSFQTTTLLFSSATTVDIKSSSYIFTGVAGTLTLPDVVKYKDKMVFVKNRGSGVLTVACSGADFIYTTAAVANIAVAAGGSAVLQSDGVYWNKM